MTCVVRNVPAGLGEPVFDKLEAKLAHAMLSIPATKGFEIGSGFRGTEVPGSKHNDPFIGLPDGRLGTATNWSGGVQGGISNAEDIYFRSAVPIYFIFVTDFQRCGTRVGFKSPATISQAQATAQYDGTAGQLAARGRHDPCVVPRAVPIVEAMASLVIMEYTFSMQSSSIPGSHTLQCFTHPKRAEQGCFVAPSSHDVASNDGSSSCA